MSTDFDQAALRYLKNLPKELREFCRIRTYSKQFVNMIDPDPETLLVRDMAWHGAHLNRYVGAASAPVNLCNHQHLVYQMIRFTTPDPLIRITALMHDAHEAYTGDINGPLSRVLAPLLKPIQKRLQKNIYESLGIFGEAGWQGDHVMVKEADMLALWFEAQGYDLNPEEWPDTWQKRDDGTPVRQFILDDGLRVALARHGDVEAQVLEAGVAAPMVWANIWMTTLYYELLQLAKQGGPICPPKRFEGF